LEVNPRWKRDTENLDKRPAPFVTVAIQALEGSHERLRKMAESLRPATTLGGEGTD